MLRRLLSFAVLVQIGEVGVAAHVDLVGAAERESALLKQGEQRPVHDGTAELALQVVPHQGDALLLRFRLQVRKIRHRIGCAVDHRDTGGQGRSAVRPCDLWQASGQRVQQDVRTLRLQDLGHGLRRLAVIRVPDAGHDLRVGLRALESEIGVVVGRSENGVRKRPAHLVLREVKSRDDIDVSDVHAIDDGMGYAREVAVHVLSIELDALGQRGNVVPHASDH